MMRSRLSSFVSLAVTLSVAACANDATSPKTVKPDASVAEVSPSQVMHPAALSLELVNEYRCNIVALASDGGGQSYRQSSVVIRNDKAEGKQIEGGNAEIARVGLTQFHITSYGKRSHSRMMEAGCVLPATKEAADFAHDYFVGLAKGPTGVGSIPMVSEWGDPLVWCTDYGSGVLVCDGTVCYNGGATLRASSARSDNDVAKAAEFTGARAYSSYTCDNGCSIYDAGYWCPGGGDGAVGACIMASPTNSLVALDCEGGEPFTDAGCTGDSDYTSDTEISAGTYDKHSFAVYLRSHAKPGPDSLKQCAHYVKVAMCSAMGVSPCFSGPDAQNYGTFLTGLGFSTSFTGSGCGYPENYTPQEGDIVVFSYTKRDGVTPTGHVAGWDGQTWTSDFIQDWTDRDGNPCSIQPDPIVHPERSYTIYRRP